MGYSKDTLIKKRHLFCLATLDPHSHVSTYHINVCDESLKRRILLNAERKYDARVSTSFYNYKDAEKWIENTLYDDNGEFSNLRLLSDWLDDASDTEILVVEANYNKMIGYGYERKGNAIWRGTYNGVIVVLDKTECKNNPFGFRIVTAYPCKR